MSWKKFQLKSRKKGHNNMEITAKLVKELRDKTGAGMMDCKRALIETDGNIEEAADALRKKGLMDAAKKSSRTAADGLVAFAISENGKTAAIVEVNSETDFVARNEKFQGIVEGIANVALAVESEAEVLGAKYPGAAHTVKDEIDSLISLVGENMNFRRSKKLSVDNGAISAYIHSAIKPGMGKIGVLVAIECDCGSGCACQEKILDLGKRIAMHVAAANPTYLCSKCIPESVIEKEKSIVLAQAKDMGKNDEIAAKMAEGRVSKFFEETALYEQVFVMDGKTKIKDIIEGFNKENNCTVKIKCFEKFVLGEGIEKTETNFAEEVQSFIK